MSKVVKRESSSSSAPGFAMSFDSYNGRVEQRSERHIAGWIVNPARPLQHPEFEVLIAEPHGEVIIASGRADRDVRWLRGAPNGAHGFYMVLQGKLSESERDHLIVRPVGSRDPIPNVAQQDDTYHPIRHVAMDIVDNCNLRCPFCVYDYSNTHRTNLMSDLIFDATIRLMPYVGDGLFWLSCLHEPTMHPRFSELIERIPIEYRSKTFFTTNLSRRMAQDYYDVLGRSGLAYVNVSLESHDPVLYERMRKGARYAIFSESWEQLLTAFALGCAPPAINYIIMAFRSNLKEIPDLVANLREHGRASSVHIRYTFDMKHIPQEFKELEFLERSDWNWLQTVLAIYPNNEVVIYPPPAMDGEVNGSERAWADDKRGRDSSPVIVPGKFEFRISYNGDVCVSPIYDGGSRPEVVPDLLKVNILEIKDHLDQFIASLEPAS